MAAIESSSANPKQVTLNDALLFNEQLLAVAATGLPIYLGCSPDLVPQTLEKINSSLALAVSRGETIQNALEKDPLVTDDYRIAIAEWIANGGSLKAADLLYRKGAWRNQMTDQMRITLLRLGILWILATTTLLVMVWSLKPKIEGIYDVSGLTPGPAFRVLEEVYNYRWLIGINFGIITLVGVLDYLRMKKALFQWIPFRKQVFKFLQYAETAELASVYAKCSTELPERLRNELTAMPLVHWASQHQDSKGGTMRALSFVSNYYRDRSVKSSKLSKTVISQLIYLTIGAAVVLTVALMLFMPLVELLITMCVNAFR